MQPFKGSDVYDIEDLGVIDYLLITHNHYDHLSKKTLKRFAKSPVSQALQKVIVPLGVGKYLRDFGFEENKIIELDWNESLQLSENLKLYFLPTRHFSGRGLWDKDKDLWGSFLLQSQEKQIYMSGDSGYGKHFKAIGEQFGTIDLALLENGQYNEYWHNVHLFPTETLQAARDLNAKALMPIHNSKFKLSTHKWDTPRKELAQEAKNYPQIRLFQPQIGEIAPLWDEDYTFTKWFE